MSALPPKADIAERDRHVRFVPKADIQMEKDLSRSADPWAVTVNPATARKLRRSDRAASRPTLKISAHPF